MKREYSPSQGLDEEKASLVKKELKLGYLNLKDGFFPQAEMDFKLALFYDEACADAFWGLMLVKLNIKNEDDLFTEPMKYKNAIHLEECKKALAAASENQKGVYNNLLESIQKVNEGDEY